MQCASRMSGKAEATSRQVLEENTLLVPVHNRVDDRLLYTTFPPTLSSQGISQEWR